MAPEADPTQPSKKGKEREAPQPTDFAARMVALQRKQAQMNKPKDRPDRLVSSASSSKPQPTPPPQSPHRKMHVQPSIVVSQATPYIEQGPDDEDFNRRLKISHSSSPKHVHKRPEPHQHTSPRGAGRLYNPNTDSILRRPAITAEPEGMSEDDVAAVARGGIASVSRYQGRVPAGRDNARLFDPKKDNPYHPGLLVRPGGTNGSPPIPRVPPTPKSSGDWVSASSTSSASYAQSTISSSFTLNSTTTDSSASSAIFSNGPRSEDSAASTSALSTRLKQLYRRVVAIEDHLTKETDPEMQESLECSPQRRAVLLKTQQHGVIRKDIGVDEGDKDRYKRLVAKHKELSEAIHDMLTLTMTPSVPSSLRHIPTKYGLVGRLWKTAFYHLLETLRRAASSCPQEAEENVALEHLVSFIYYAYTFYSGLLDELNLSPFVGNWVECLGDLARYRSAVAQLLESRAGRTIPGTLTASAVARASLPGHRLLCTGPGTPEVSTLSEKNASPTPAVTPIRMPRIDDSPPASDGLQQPLVQLGMAPSVGIVAARQMEMLPEKEQWRLISREWFTKGLLYAPTSGKLHHYLGMLSRDAEPSEKEDLRAVYHFAKSMIAAHPFTTSRETVLPLWSSSAQARRQAPDAGLTDLFLLLQGMIFTNIQLDDFKSVLARFEEKLMLEGGDVQEQDWIMMAVINIGSIFEYGRPSAVLGRVAGLQSDSANTGAANPSNSNGRMKVVSRRVDIDEKTMDVDDDEAARATASPALSEAAAINSSSNSLELPLSLKYALQLTFTMLTHTLKNPIRQPHALSRSSLNPYITVILTFLSTVLKDRVAERALARVVPWEELARFFTGIPRRIMQEASKDVPLVSTGCDPLPEDWCLRGMGWSGKKIYERGFWKRDLNGEEKNLETEVLDRKETDAALMDGIIEDEDDQDDELAKNAGGRRSNTKDRWLRIARAAVRIGKVVNGMVYTPPIVLDGRGEWRVEGVLADKVAKWREEDRREKAEEERRLRGTRWESDEDDMDVDDEYHVVDVDSMSEDEGGDASDEVRALKDRLNYLQSLLSSSKRPVPESKRLRASSARENSVKRLQLVPGYTILVVDTNILLSSLSMIASLVESLEWTVVIPLPVIMELDGLSSDSSVLGEAAVAASHYIISHLRTHSTSLKIQTSKGNYLTNLNVRTEQVDLRDNQSWERNMDDLILRAAIWQSTHWVDRSVFLQSTGSKPDTTNASKVVLLTFDRMLRLKARSRDVDAAGEQDLAALLASPKP